MAYASLRERLTTYKRLLELPRRAYLLGGTSRLSDIPRVLLAAREAPAQVDAYHDAIRAALGVRHVFSYGSGRMGLYELLRALDVRAGDEVILPGYTCVVMPAAILRLGARPVYADIDEATLNVKVDAVAAAITPRTRVILAQHTFGIPCDLDALQALATRHGLHLIEDGAHALGASYHGTPCGQFGVAALFSTEKSKMISTEKGGLVTTNDDALAARLRTSWEALPQDDPERVRRALGRWILFDVERLPRLGELAEFVDRHGLRRFGRLRNALEAIEHYDDVEYAEALQVKLREPFPARLAPALALVGRLQAGRLAADVARRNRLARRLAAAAERHGWTVPRIDWEGTQPSFIRFPFLVDGRRGWMKALRRARIEPGTWLNHPMHPAGSDFEACGYRPGLCPTADRVAERIVNLPLHPRVGDWMVEAVEGLGGPIPDDGPAPLRNEES
ncbi:MAG: DegT/DnrJ/EryC1/StrS family aminotransferase [Vicinamibacterales bacterium]